MNNVFARLFTSRKVWIALSGVAGTIATLLCANPDKWTPLIGSIVTLATVCIAAIGYEDGQAKSVTGPYVTKVTNARPANGASMNILALLLLPLLLLSGGCQQLATPAQSDRVAERLTFEAIADSYSAYVAADPKLSAEQKARRERTVATWRMRVMQTEGSN